MSPVLRHVFVPWFSAKSPGGRDILTNGKPVWQIVGIRKRREFHMWSAECCLVLLYVLQCYITCVSLVIVSWHTLVSPSLGYPRQLIVPHLTQTWYYYR